MHSLAFSASLSSDGSQTVNGLDVARSWVPVACSGRNSLNGSWALDCITSITYNVERKRSFMASSSGCIYIHTGTSASESGS
jgi:hypothetical protein